MRQWICAFKHMWASVAQLDAPFDLRPGGRGFNFAEVGNILSLRLIPKYTVILSLPLVQEGRLSVSGERMCTILVNRLEDYACPVNMWLGKLTALDMTPLGWLGRKTSTQTNKQTKSNICDIENVPSNICNIEHVPSNVCDIEHVPLNICNIEHVPSNVCDIEHVPLNICNIEYVPLNICDIEYVPSNICHIEQMNSKVCHIGCSRSRFLSDLHSLMLLFVALQRFCKYSRLSLSRTRLSRITAYFEVKNLVLF